MGVLAFGDSSTWALPRNGSTTGALATAKARRAARFGDGTVPESREADGADGPGRAGVTPRNAWPEGTFTITYPRGYGRRGAGSCAAARATKKRASAWRRPRARAAEAEAALEARRASAGGVAIGGGRGPRGAYLGACARGGRRPGAGRESGRSAATSHSRRRRERMTSRLGVGGARPGDASSRDADVTKKAQRRRMRRTPRSAREARRSATQRARRRGPRGGGGGTRERGDPRGNNGKRESAGE